MSQPSFPKRGCVIAVVVLAAVVALAPIQSIRWSGGFPATEFRFLFTDSHGRPVPGVTLRVETKAGGASYLYPIDEFLPHQVPTSDTEGRMTFHQAGGGGASFGGSVSRSLVGVQYGDFVVPQHVCVFSHGGREVHRARFNDLSRGGRGEPSTVEVA